MSDNPGGINQPPAAAAKLRRSGPFKLSKASFTCWKFALASSVHPWFCGRSGWTCSAACLYARRISSPVGLPLRPRHWRAASRVGVAERTGGGAADARGGGDGRRGDCAGGRGGIKMLRLDALRSRSAVLGGDAEKPRFQGDEGLPRGGEPAS